MKKKKTLITVLGIIVIVLTIFATLLFTGVIDIKPKPVEQQEEIIQDVVEVKNIQAQRDIWLNNKNINNDYVGEVIFDSGLIQKSFVQAKDVFDGNGILYHFYNEDGSLVSDPSDYTGNDVYIWTNWKDMSYDYNLEGGSVFMDYRNSLDDQNIIIYGHHFSEAGGNDPKRNKAFTPLEKLLESDNYKDNNTVKLILDNETRSYELVGVYKFDINDDFYLEKLQYYRTYYNYDEFENIADDTYYDKYIKALDIAKLYDTGVKLSNNDRTLTLQTCISGLAGSVFEICVFRQTNIEYFED